MKFSGNNIGCFIAIKVAVFFSVWGSTHSQEDQEGGECGKLGLIRCVDPLQVLTNKQNISFATSKQDLDELCPKLKQGLICIERYTKLCMSQEQQEQFNRLYAGTTMAIGKLCSDEEYQNEFLQHAPCVVQAKKEYEACATKYQQEIKDLNKYANNNNTSQGENKQLQKVCCSFQAYLSCSERTVRQKCGPKTAKFTKEFFDLMASSLIQNHCEHYPPDSQVCMMDPSSGSTIGSSLVSILALLAFLGLGWAHRT